MAWLTLSKKFTLDQSLIYKTFPNYDRLCTKMFPRHKSLLQVNLDKKHQILCPGEIRERMGWFAKSNIRAPAVKRYGLGQGCGFDLSQPKKKRGKNRTKIRIRDSRKVRIRPETALNNYSQYLMIKIITVKIFQIFQYFYNFGLISFY